MRARRNVGLLVIAALAAGCGATGTPSVPPAGAAPDHGWLDFTVRDLDVPSDPFAKLADGSIQPPSCELTVRLDGRDVHSQTLAPRGAGPPYRVESGFRVAVPPGEYGAAVTYTGCRSHARGLDSVEVELQIAVRSRRITRVRFDGTLLEADFPSPSDPEPASR